MLIMKSYNHSKTMRRCHTPLIEICDTTTQIKLDLGSCGVCTAKPAALILQKSGCVEYETVCDPPVKTPCCGVIDNRPAYWGNKRTVEKPKPSVIYPLHEIDPQGMSVFVLDSKLKELGYGRYRASVVITDKPIKDMSFTPTGVEFDIEYMGHSMGLNSISVETAQGNIGDC